MPTGDELLDTGTIVARHCGARGRMVSVAITLPAHVWVQLTKVASDQWQQVQDDLDVRELTSTN